MNLNKLQSLPQDFFKIDIACIKITPVLQLWIMNRYPDNLGRKIFSTLQNACQTLDYLDSIKPSCGVCSHWLCKVCYNDRRSLQYYLRILQSADIYCSRYINILNKD